MKNKAALTITKLTLEGIFTVSGKGRPKNSIRQASPPTGTPEVTTKQEAQMRRTLVAIALAVGILISVVSCGPGTSSVPGQKILDLINEKRVAAGCPAVTGDDQLRVAADRHAVDMRDKSAHLQPGTDGHTGSDGSRPEQRIKDAGFMPLTRYGEVIYWSDQPSSETATVDWWMNSPPHKAIILNCQFTHAGVGLLYPGGAKWYAVVDFGRHN